MTTAIADWGPCSSFLIAKGKPAKDNKGFHNLICGFYNFEDLAII
jgi:hypothetical protein